MRYDTAEDYDLYLADCRAVLPGIAPNTLDAVVTDPPYNLAFMGKKWDDLGGPGMFQAWCRDWGKHLYRAMKPGAYGVVFGGTRTYHRMVSGLEDAGFAIRDQLIWLYGGGMPKGLDVGKAIDKDAGAERAIVGIGGSGATRAVLNAALYPDTFGGDYAITAPSSDAAKLYEGMRSQLKPAWEPIALIQKPPDRAIADNVRRWGVGALNIEECRIPTTSALVRPAILREDNAVLGLGLGLGTQDEPGGRYPANVLMDEEAAAQLDAMAGDRRSGQPREDRGTGGLWRPGDGVPVGPQYGDSGGASRFFYSAKANRRDRGAGNTHPTVKPIRLLRYLCRLVVPVVDNGRIPLVIDPFMGSGRIGIAAICEGGRFIGTEKDEHSYEIAARHIPDAGDYFGWSDPFGDDVE